MAVWRDGMDGCIAGRDGCFCGVMGRCFGLRYDLLYSGWFGWTARWQVLRFGLGADMGENRYDALAF